MSSELVTESILGFRESVAEDVVENKSHSFKLVPWISWDEWEFVRRSLFSSSPDSVASALRRISAWRSRGCVPVVVEVTASIVEIQQKDPFFRNCLTEKVTQSDEMLAMLYCMAIMRLVNGVIEKTRRKNEVSIGEAADFLGIPRMLIDIRHEGSHRDLPSLQLVRLASQKALDWLISYYWEPQERAIAVQHNQAANLRREIKKRLREVAFYLKAKQEAKSSSSRVKGKRARRMEHLSGCNKFLNFAVAHSTSAGPKKQFGKSLKNILRLYNSSSSEVVYALLEYLLKALDSSMSVEKSDSQIVDNPNNKHNAFDHWKSVTLKLLSRQPDFILTLCRAVLEKMENNGALKSGTDGYQSPEDAGSHSIELLSSLFEWLVGYLKNLNAKTEKHLPRSTVFDFLHRCLLVSPPTNKQLMGSAVTLAHLSGDSTLLLKLKKLALLREPSSVDSFSETPLSQQDFSLREAEEKLELFKLQRMKTKREEKPKQSEVGAKSRWAVAKSWNPCPIGMLPHTVGFSGRLPVLDRVDDCREGITISDSSKGQPHGKREAEIGIDEINTIPVKKAKETEADQNLAEDKDNTITGFRGCLMMEGVWKRVGEGELRDVSSAIRLLV